jgi:hypothetical protein
LCVTSASPRSPITAIAASAISCWRFADRFCRVTRIRAAAGTSGTVGLRGIRMTDLHCGTRAFYPHDAALGTLRMSHVHNAATRPKIDQPSDWF